MAIIITFIVIIGVCACNHRCPLYKWRHRREHPPIGVVITEVIHGNEENNIGRHVNCGGFSQLILTFTPLYCNLHAEDADYIKHSQLS